jgi:hypothetical protein
MLSWRMFFGDLSYFPTRIHLFWLSLPLGTLIWAQARLQPAGLQLRLRAANSFSNRRKMNTYVKLVPNFSGMNTYAIEKSEALQNEHLRKKGWGRGWSVRP